MGIINGTFIYNGEPRNGATAKLWEASAFVSPPEFDEDEPVSGQVGLTIVTGTEYGGNGAYRWTGVDNGEYYVSVEYLGHRSFIYQNVEEIRDILTTEGDILYNNGAGLARLPVGSEGQVLYASGGTIEWGDLPTAWVVVPSLKNSNDTVRQTSSTSYVKLKETKLDDDFSGNIIIRFDYATSQSSSNGFWRIYRNGIAIGEELNYVNVINTWYTYTATFNSVDWSDGDLIQIYCKSLVDSYLTSVRNFRFYYIKEITNVSIGTTSQDP